MCVYRAMHFWFVTVKLNLASTNQYIERIIIEKEAACKKYAIVLGSLDTDKINSAVELTRIRLAEDVFTCTSEAAALRSFILQADVFNIPRFALSDNVLISGLVHETIRNSASITGGTRCSTLVCIDWVSALDFAPIQHAVFSFFPFSARSDTEAMILASIALTVSLGLSFVSFHALVTRAILLIHPARLSSLLLVVDVLLSSKARILRLLVLLCSYMSAFIVAYDNPSETLLIRVIRVFFHAHPLTLVTSFVLYWILGALFLLQTTWIHERLTCTNHKRKLEETHKEIARTWLNSGVETMRKLHPVSIIRVLGYIHLESLDSELKSQVARLIIDDPMLKAVHSQRGAFDVRDTSTEAQFTREVSSVLTRLGYREYPNIFNLLLCALTAGVSLLLW